MIEYIDSLTPREAKLLNTYTNVKNEHNNVYKSRGFYDDAYKHDENDIDYKEVLKRKIDYIPDDYAEVIEQYRTEYEDLTLQEKREEACRAIYMLSCALEHDGHYDLMDRLHATMLPFMGCFDEWDNIDDLYQEFIKEHLLPEGMEEETNEETDTQNN